MNETRCKFYNDFVQDNSSNQRSLFSAVKKHLNRRDNWAVYPSVNNNVKLANQLGTFFVQKIETIGSKLVFGPVEWMNEEIYQFPWCLKLTGKDQSA